MIAVEPRPHVGGSAGGVLAQVALDEAVEVEAGSCEATEEVGAVMLPAAVRCPTSSCTFHLSHHVGAVHCSGVSVSRNSASERRSAWTIGIRSAIAPPSLSRAVVSSRSISVRVKLGDRRISAPGLATISRDALRSLHDVLAGDSAKWTVADEIPERDLAHAATRAAVVAEVDVDSDPATTFAAFTDAEVYSRWLGVPVSIDDGRFGHTLMGGPSQGVYEHVVEPDLIALRWDFEDDNVPIPGGERVGCVRFTAVGTGCHVEVHQLLDRAEHGEFMEAAWTFVLGRLKAGVVRRPTRRRNKAALGLARRCCSALGVWPCVASRSRSGASRHPSASPDGVAVHLAVRLEPRPVVVRGQFREPSERGRRPSRNGSTFGSIFGRVVGAVIARAETTSPRYNHG